MIYAQATDACMATLQHLVNIHVPPAMSRVVLSMLLQVERLASPGMKQAVENEEYRRAMLGMYSPAAVTAHEMAMARYGGDPMMGPNFYGTGYYPGAGQYPGVGYPAYPGSSRSRIPAHPTFTMPVRSESQRRFPYKFA